MRQRGFTLIELIVAVGILLFLIGVGLANYIGFNERQQLIQAAEQVREAVADAQNSARSGKLRGCAQLAAYRVEIEEDQVQVQSVCSSGSAEAARVFAFPSTFTVTSTDTYYISPLRGRVYTDAALTESSPSYRIQLENDSDIAEVRINHSGSVETTIN